VPFVAALALVHPVRRVDYHLLNSQKSVESLNQCSVCFDGSVSGLLTVVESLDIRTYLLGYYP
jgi:hypothetical protein